jgi:hypothetical protein
VKVVEATGGVRFACAKINCFGLQFRMILKSILKDNLKNFFTLIMGVDKRGNKLTKRRKDMAVPRGKRQGVQRARYQVFKIL